MSPVSHRVKGRIRDREAALALDPMGNWQRGWLWPKWQDVPFGLKVMKAAENTLFQTLEIRLLIRPRGGMMVAHLKVVKRIIFQKIRSCGKIR